MSTMFTRFQLVLSNLKLNCVLLHHFSFSNTYFQNQLEETIRLYSSKYKMEQIYAYKQYEMKKKCFL